MLGFGVQDLGFRGSGFRLRGSGDRLFGARGLGFRAVRLNCACSPVGCRVQGFRR